MPVSAQPEPAASTAPASSEVCAACNGTRYVCSACQGSPLTCLCADGFQGPDIEPCEQCADAEATQRRSDGATKGGGA